MGKRGPAPTPTALKLLRGEKRPSRLNRSEPKPRGAPIKPAGMSRDASAIWRRLIRDYGHTGVLTAVDSDVLRAYCEAVVRYERAAQMLEETGPLVRGARRGELVKNPLHQVVRDNADLMRQLARELGFTPSARSAIKSPIAEGDEDPLAAWEASS